MGRLWQVIHEELHGLHPRLWLIQLLLAPLPNRVGSRLRIYAFRFIGFQIGHGSVMWGTPSITGDRHMYSNLKIGRGCWFNVGCFFDLSDKITIGDQVAFGHQVIVLTSTHEIGSPEQRAAASRMQPVVIESGAWIGARCTILPGVTIGSGSIVAAGAVVNKDIPPNTLAAGVPARVVKHLL